jgi:hypothetical protein
MCLLSRPSEIEMLAPQGVSGAVNNLEQAVPNMCSPEGAWGHPRARRWQKGSSVSRGAEREPAGYCGRSRLDCCGPLLDPEPVTSPR